MPSHEERAREICSPEYFGGVRANDLQHIKDVAQALAAVEREAIAAERSRVIEECAKVAEAEPELEGEPPLGFARTDPVVASRAAVRATKKSIAAAIRDLGKQTGGAA